MGPLQLDLTGAAFIAVWSSGYIGGSIAATAAAPLSANLWRFVAGVVILGLIARRRRESWPAGVREYAAAGAVGVLLFAVQFGGLYIGMSSGTPASTTALIACSSPLLVATASALLGWDSLSARRWLGIAVVPGVGGPLLFLALICTRGAKMASSLLLVVPAVTAIAAWLVLDAPVGLTAVAGLVASGAGLWLATRPNRERGTQNRTIDLRTWRSSRPSTEWRWAG